MRNHLMTYKMIRQLNDLYEIQVLNGSELVRTERNYEYQDAVDRIEELKEEEKNAAS